MTALSPARVAADVASILPIDDPLARIARLRLDAAVRVAERTAMTACTVTIGTPLRDAAVDPLPEDHLPPVNAGTDDPHGPEVFSVEVDGRHLDRVPELDQERYTRMVDGAAQ